MKKNKSEVIIVGKEDLLNDECEENQKINKHGSWKELFRPFMLIYEEKYGVVARKQRLRLQILNIIWDTFWEVLMEDLIIKDNIFVFPRRSNTRTGELSIVNILRNVKEIRYVGFPDEDKVCYRMFFKEGKYLFHNLEKKYYRVKLCEKSSDLLNSTKKDRHAYQ
jgi:hypothetical protein